MQNYRIIAKAAAVLALLIGGLVPLQALNTKGTSDSPAIDVEKYQAIMSHRVRDMQDLEDWTSLNQHFYLPILPPVADLTLRQEGDPVVLPFALKSLPSKFLHGLSGVYEYSVLVYPVTIVEDPDSHALTFYNLENKPFFVSPADVSYDPFAFLKERWPWLYAGNTDPRTRSLWETFYNPARIVVTTKLIDENDVERWLYARSLVLASEPLLYAAKYSVPMDGVTISNLHFTGISKATNGIKLTVVYTNSFTNGLDVFMCNDLMGEVWGFAAKNLPTTGTNLTWVDTNSWVFSGMPVRFYAASDATVDADGDGYADGREIMVYNTDPNSATSHPVTVSGAISYIGGETGTFYVLFNTESNDWSLAKSIARAGTGSYTNDEIGNNKDYWFSAFRDVNGNFAHEAWEPGGVHSDSPTLVTGSLAGVDIALRDVPSVWGQISYTGSATGDIHVIAVANSNSWDTTYETVIPYIQNIGMSGELYYVTFPASYSIIGVPASNYWIRAFMDADTNGVVSAFDPAGRSTTNATPISNRVTGVNFTISADSDSDELPDWWEIGYGLDPHDSGDASTDADCDTLSNAEEFQMGTNPNAANAVNNASPAQVTIEYRSADVDREKIGFRAYEPDAENLVRQYLRYEGGGDVYFSNADIIHSMNWEVERTVDALSGMSPLPGNAGQLVASTINIGTNDFWEYDQELMTSCSLSGSWNAVSIYDDDGVPGFDSCTYDGSLGLEFPLDLGGWPDADIYIVDIADYADTFWNILCDTNGYSGTITSTSRVGTLNCYGFGYTHESRLSVEYTTVMLTNFAWINLGTAPALTTLAWGTGWVYQVGYEGGYWDWYEPRVSHEYYTNSALTAAVHRLTTNELHSQLARIGYRLHVPTQSGVVTRVNVLEMFQPQESNTLLVLTSRVVLVYGTGGTQIVERAEFAIEPPEERGIVFPVVLKVDITFADPDDSGWADLEEKKVILSDKDTRIKIKITPQLADLQTIFNALGTTLKIKTSETAPNGLGFTLTAQNTIMTQGSGYSELRVALTRAQLISLGVLQSQESDSVNEKAWIDHGSSSSSDPSNLTDGEAFESGSSAQSRGRSTNYGDLSSTPPNSPVDETFFVAAGREVLTAEYGFGISHKRQIMNQADYFYYSGHGGHDTSILQGGFSASDVTGYWDKDLHYVILAGCSVLDIKDYRAQSFGLGTWLQWYAAGGSWSPGAQWEPTGPKYFLGYNWSAPLDNQGSAGIISNFLTALGGGASIVDAWNQANDLGVGRNACVIDANSSTHVYWYWDETSGTPVWTNVTKSGGSW